MPQNNRYEQQFLPALAELDWTLIKPLVWW
jgi:hypothetical protein